VVKILSTFDAGAARDCSGKLGMAPAIRNYATYREEPIAWALGRFILAFGSCSFREPIDGLMELNLLWPTP